jgi:hypothetical protein
VRHRGPVGLAPLLALLALSMGAQPVAGQQATISASLTVLVPAGGTGLRPLDFGTIFPGSPREVFPADPVSGWFQLANVGKNRNVQLTLTFPTFLAHAGGGPGLAAYFDGPYLQSCGNGCQAHTLTPTSSGPLQTSATVVHVRPFPFGPNPRTVDIYVGGRVDPTTNQAAGVYQGAIQLVFAVL